LVSLAHKLGLHAGDRLALVSAPDDLPDRAFGAEGVRISRRSSANAEVTVAFFQERRSLARRLPRLAGGLRPGHALWIAWPKRASGVATDLSDHAVRELGLAAGLVDNKVCAIDQTWSALRFTTRRGSPSFNAR
jgi:hypothetical protein